MTANHDINGWEWMTVRYTIEVEVMANNKQEAIYFADLQLQANYGVRVDDNWDTEVL